MIKPTKIYSFKSHRGKIRKNNEDYFGHYKDQFFLVADGLGGHPKGEVAAKLAVETAISVFKTTKQLKGKALLKKIFEQANQTVYKETIKLIKTTGVKMGMGTTLVAALFEADSAYIGNIGDSRAYLFSGQNFEQITKDHVIDQETSPGIWLHRVIGIEEQIKPDFFSKKFNQGDLLLLCTDGLTDILSDGNIAKFLKEAGQTQKGLDGSTEKLISAALSKGGLDNITACSIKRI